MTRKATYRTAFLSGAFAALGIGVTLSASAEQAAAQPMITSEMWSIIKAILGTGLAWTGVVLWAVKALLAKQNALVGNQLATLNDSLGKTLAEIHKRLERGDDRMRAHEEKMHRMELETMEMRREIANDSADRFVHQRDFDALARRVEQIIKATGGTPA